MTALVLSGYVAGVREHSQHCRRACASRALCRRAIEWRPELDAVLASQDAGAEVSLATLSWKRRLTLHHLEIQPDVRCRGALHQAADET